MKRLNCVSYNVYAISIKNPQLLYIFVSLLWSVILILVIQLGLELNLTGILILFPWWLMILSFSSHLLISHSLIFFREVSTQIFSAGL